MNPWLAHTFSITDWISAARGAYCGLRSSSGTCIGGGLDGGFGTVGSNGGAKSRVLYQ
jgi:hypothetical protein